MYDKPHFLPEHGTQPLPYGMLAASDPEIRLRYLKIDDRDPLFEFPVERGTGLDDATSHSRPPPALQWS
jgi:hypothetical protein